MGTTSSIAKPDPKCGTQSTSSDFDNEPTMKRHSRGSKSSFVIPPAPPLPPAPAVPPPEAASKSKTSAASDSRGSPGDGDKDEVDAPLYDPSSRKDVFGQDVKSNKNSEENKKKPPLIEMNESDRKHMEKLKEESPKLAKVFDGYVTFVSGLNADPGLKTDLTYLQNLLERDVEAVFMDYEDAERKCMGDFLAVIGGAEVICRSYDMLMTDLGLDHVTDRIIQAHVIKPQISFLYGVRGVLWNYCDASHLFCERAGQTGIYDFLIRDLQNMKTALEESVKESIALGYAFESAVGILHNTSKNSTCRRILRAKGLSGDLLPFLKCKDTKVKMITLLTLANLLDESQNHLLLVDDTVFDFILSMTKVAWKSPDHRALGFSVFELMEGMTGLAKNDDNKKLLVKKDVLSLLQKLIEKGNPEEKREGVRLIWELSFDKDNRKAISENKEFLDLLKSLKKSDDKKMCHLVSGALWEIHMEDVDKAIEGGEGQAAEGKGHIMISYQWTDQKKLLQVKECLRESGFGVWMDVDNMGGSTLQAMAEAIQNADAVLVCMSERYKESQNCRSEAEYAFYLQKPIIPLIMQRGYKPDGWLGFILGTKLFYDFSGKYEFDEKLNELIKGLGNKGRMSSHHRIPVDESKVPVIRAVVDAARGSGIANWTSKDVHNWISKSKVTMNSSLKELTGQHLVFLRKLSHRAPEFYYSYIERKLHLESMDDLMLFSNALDSLT